MAEPAIDVQGLRKAYLGREGRVVVAVDDLSFRIERGEVYALLGHNGAGKSTTVEILEGHRARDAGGVRVLGFDPAAGGRELRDRIGIVLQSSGVEPQFSVREALQLYATPYRRPRRVDELVALTGLEEVADRRVGALSGGQRRRLDLALGLVGSPEVLFLDEPTTGFDPAARRQAWALVAQLRDAGTTVLLTTHYLDEAEQLADRVGVLASGRLVAEGTPRELVASTADSTIAFAAPDALGPLDLDAVLGRDGAPPWRLVAHRGRRVEVATVAPTAVLARLTGWAAGRGAELDGLTVTRPTLEDVFLALDARDDAGVAP